MLVPCTGYHVNMPIGSPRGKSIKQKDSKFEVGIRLATQVLLLFSKINAIAGHLQKSCKSDDMQIE